MDDYLPKSLQTKISRLRGRNIGPKNKIWKSMVLILGMGLFFYSFHDSVAFSKKDVVIQPTALVGSLPEKKIGTFVIKNKKNFGSGVPIACAVDKVVVVPIKKIDKAITEIGEKKDALQMVTGYPLEKMVPFIGKRNKQVAAFLVAIAKKESDWGKYSPKKAGRDCFNYWGFKGKYNPTESGYSCFDSPEQAIQAVGDRIEDLINKRIDTPERMIVWKCGSTCAGHDPGGVRKWIADVEMYVKKMNS
jgi:hypothetical protein